MDGTQTPDTGSVAGAAGSSARELPPKALALIAFAEDLARRGGVMDQKTIAQQLDIGESTISRYVSTYEEVVAALRPVLPLSAARKVERALAALLSERVVITHVLLAEKADVSPDTVSRVKVEDPELGRSIEEAVATSLSRKIESLIQERNGQGLPVTQRWIAEALNVSESSIVNYKNTDPAIHRLIEDARPLSAVEKVRAVVEDLKAENIPPTVAHIVDRAGLHQGTVSKVKLSNDDLAQDIVKAPPPLHLRMTAADVEAELAARIQMYGDERCNTVSALNRSRTKGGNRALLRACQRLEIALPRAQPREVNALTSYLHRIADTKLLYEEEAVGLWNNAMAGDREAMEELLVRTRPLVAFVIQNVLHEDIEPTDFKSNLIEYLISQGDYIITTGWGKWDGKGGLLWYFNRILGDGLREARLSYYYSRKVEERRLVSVNAPLGGAEEGDDALTLAESRQMESGELSPDITVGLLSDAFPFGEDELVDLRDASSGVGVVLSLNKQVMAASLKEVFHSPELSSVLESGVRNDWALFMVGSTGRLGTAIQGECSAHLVLLTDASDIFTRKAMALMASRLSGRLEAHPATLPTIIIGRGRDFDRIMKWIAVNAEQHKLLQKFVASLSKFGVGLSSGHGMAIIDAATVAPTKGIVSNIPETELFFQTAKNGLRVAESREGAHKVLIRKLMVRMCRSGGVGSAAAALAIANEVLEFELSFLEAQKTLLERARAAMETTAARLDKDTASRQTARDAKTG